MKISIIGDVHCGFGFGTERESDSFAALDEAISRSLDADLIIQVGDLFDSRIPRQEVFARVAKILRKIQNVECSTKILDLCGKDLPHGIPFIAIHGTHERRSKTFINPIQALESAGLLVHLHAQTALFEIDGRKVAVHGLSGVPDRYAYDCLMRWSPKPVPNAINILILHQSIEPYIYNPLDPPSLKIEHLPNGFDLFVLGHVHWHEHKLLHGAQLLLTGSLIPTTLHRHETQQKKGFWTYDGTILNFLPLKNQRKVYWETFEFSDGIEQYIKHRLSEILSIHHEMKPLIMLRLHGRLPEGKNPPMLNEILEPFSDKAIIKVNNKLELPEIPQETNLIKILKSSNLSPEEQGLKLLQERLTKAECELNVHEIFELLVDANLDRLVDYFGGKDDNKS